MEKICTGCKETKTLNEYYWREKRNNYSAKCKICWSQESKNYNLENKEKRTQYYNEWRKDNDNWKTYQREYKKNSTPQQRVIYNLRNRVYKLMLKDYKGQQTLELIGCSRQEFMDHLEKQFTSEMNWRNYGTYWEVDHITPLSKGGTIRWDNSRPLIISENRKKYNKTN